MGSEFDQYARDYREIINRGAAITGETFEYFIGLRVELLAREIEAGGARTPLRILDFGCGIGATEKVLRDRFPSAAIDGVDPSVESIKTARALGLRDVMFHVSDSDRLPFADSSFDLIYSNGTLHHIDRDKHAAVLGELRRVLSPGGHLFVFENNPLNPLMVRGMRQNPFDAGVKMLFPWYLRKLVKGADLKARNPRYYVWGTRP